MRQPHPTPFALLSLLGLAACALHRVPAPPPGQPADVAAMTSVVERTRSHPPHRGFSLAVAPVTLNYEADIYRLDLRPEFSAAVADLVTKGGRLDTIPPPFIGGIRVRHLAAFDRYDLAQYLLLRFSPVGFSADSTRAALLVVFDCGPGCGSQAGVGLRRVGNGGWRIAQYRRRPLPAPAEPSDQEPR